MLQGTYVILVESIIIFLHERFDPKLFYRY